MRVLVTGGAGFIGSTLVRHLIQERGHQVRVLDKLTYAGSRSSLTEVADHPAYSFMLGDVCDRAFVEAEIRTFRPDAILHLAAESHVDRSIEGPSEFIQTNIVGTGVLLEVALAYQRGLTPDAAAAFRFHHVSTDEVFGSLGTEGRFDEQSPYDPRSPYSASKAASDHLVRAWGHTYGLPVLVSNCSNNYGPRQHPEKLFPMMIIRALNGQTLPVYGDGLQRRDWLFVEDHAHALSTVLERGLPGRTYAVGGDAERTNLEVVQAICDALDRAAPRPDARPHAEAIVHVADRPGHDRRYAIDGSRIARELDWRPEVSFETGVTRTVDWYLNHRDWWEPILRAADETRRRGLAHG